MRTGPGRWPMPPLLSARTEASTLFRWPSGDTRRESDRRQIWRAAHETRDDSEALVLFLEKGAGPRPTPERNETAILPREKTGLQPHRRPGRRPVRARIGRTCKRAAQPAEPSPSVLLESTRLRTVFRQVVEPRPPRSRSRLLSTASSAEPPRPREQAGDQALASSQPSRGGPAVSARSVMSDPQIRGTIACPGPGRSRYK